MLSVLWYFYSLFYFILYKVVIAVSVIKPLICNPRDADDQKWRRNETKRKNQRTLKMMKALLKSCACQVIYKKKEEERIE